MLPICQSLGDQSAREEGLGQMIAQAWQQHERDRVLVSNSPKDVLDVSVNNGMMLRTKV